MNTIGIISAAVTASAGLILLNAGIIFAIPKDKTTNTADIAIDVIACNNPIGLTCDNKYEDIIIDADNATNKIGIKVAAASAVTGSTLLKADIILPIPKDITVKTPAITIDVMACNNPTGLTADNTNDANIIDTDTASNTTGNILAAKNAETGFILPNAEINLPRPIDTTANTPAIIIDENA